MARKNQELFVAKAFVFQSANKTVEAVTHRAVTVDPADVTASDAPGVHAMMFPRAE